MKTLVGSDVALIFTLFLQMFLLTICLVGSRSIQRNSIVSAALRVIAGFVTLALWSGVAVAQTPQLLDAADQSLGFYQKGELLSALPFAEEAARLAEEEFGANHVTTATHNHNLAAVYQQLGWLDFAEPLLVRTLAIREEKLGTDHPHGSANL